MLVLSFTFLFLLALAQAKYTTRDTDASNLSIETFGSLEPRGVAFSTSPDASVVASAASIVSIAASQAILSSISTASLAASAAVVQPGTPPSPLPGRLAIVGLSLLAVVATLALVGHLMRRRRRQVGRDNDHHYPGSHRSISPSSEKASSFFPRRGRRQQQRPASEESFFTSYELKTAPPAVTTIEDVGGQSPPALTYTIWSGVEEIDVDLEHGGREIERGEKDPRSPLMTPAPRSSSFGSLASLQHLQFPAPPAPCHAR